MWILDKHCVETRFPKDRNCEICQRTKITRAPCRRSIGGVVPRAENFGDLITADHKVLSEGCESRNNHRYVIVVQDLATQWIQSYPCKTKTSQETQRSLQKFLEPDRKPKVIYTDNSLEFGKACEALSRNHCTSTPRRTETNGIVERAVCRVKEGTYCYNQVWMKIGGQIPWNVTPTCEMLQISYLTLNPIWGTFWETIWRTNRSVWFTGWVLPYICERPVKNPSIWKESLTWIVPWIRFVRGENLEGWRTGCRRWGVGNDGRIRNLLEKNQCKGSNIFQRKWKFYFSSRRWTNQSFWKRSGTENTHLDTGTSTSRRKSRWFSWRIRRVSSSTSRLTSGCRWSDKWFLVHVRKLQIPPSRWTKSQNFTRREKNHSLFHWNTLTYPELHKRIRMSSKSDASTIIEFRWVSRLVRSLDRFHTIYSVGRETSKRIYVVRGETDKKAVNIQARSFMARTLDQNGKKCPAEGQKWSPEKPKLDNARKLRGIYLIDFKRQGIQTITNARKKLETSMALAMPCKTSKTCKHGVARGKPNEFKSNLACILEASESTRLRMEESLPNYHENHIAGKWDNSLQQHNSVQKFIPVPQAMKIPSAKAAVDKEWEKLKRFRRGDLTKVRSKKEVIDEARTKGAKSSFCLTDGHLSFEECRIGGKTPKIQKVELYSEAILWMMILDLMQYSPSKDHQHHKWQQQKSWISYPDCPGAQDKQLMQYLLKPM